MDLICDFTISVEKKRGQSIEDVQKRILLNKLKKNKYKAYMSGNKMGNDKQKQEDEDDTESYEASLSLAINKSFLEDFNIV